MKKPIKVLAYCLSPAITSGVSAITRQVFKQLAKKNNIDLYVYGISDLGNPKSKKTYPYPIYSFANANDPDIYHRNHFLSVLQGQEPSLPFQWDIVLIIGHPAHLTQPTQLHQDGVLAHIRYLQQIAYKQKTPDQWFKTMGIYLIDSPIKDQWMHNCIGITDQICTLSPYATRQILRHTNSLQHKIITLPPIIHKTFFRSIQPSRRQHFRDQYFRGQVDEDTFLITNIAKNYHLNDLTRTLDIFARFKKDHPQAYLYLHTPVDGPFANLVEYANHLGLTPVEDWAYPGYLTKDHSTPLEELRHLYAISDVFLQTTQATWWDVSLSEAMASRTLCIAPNIGPIQDQLNSRDINPNNLDYYDTSLRGLPISAGHSDSLWLSWGVGDHNLKRPLTDVDHATKHLDWAYHHPNQAKTIANRGHRWIKKHASIDKVDVWSQAILDLYHQLQQERQDSFNTITKYFS